LYWLFHLIEVDDADEAADAMEQDLDRLEKLLAVAQESDQAGRSTCQFVLCIQLDCIIVVIAGKFSEAGVMYTAAWEIQKQRFGINDIESLSTMHTLGALMESEERLEEARSMYEQCHALRVCLEQRMTVRC
jgi:hypothetical protein